MPQMRFARLAFLLLLIAAPSLGAKELEREEPAWWRVVPTPFLLGLASPEAMCEYPGLLDGLGERPAPDASTVVLTSRLRALASGRASPGPLDRAAIHRFVIDSAHKGHISAARLALGADPQPTRELIRGFKLLLHAERDSVRCDAAFILQQSPALAGALADDLLDMMQHDRSESVRYMASETLAITRTRSADVSMLLSEVLRHPDVEPRHVAAAQLALLGEAGALAIPHLLEMLRQRDRSASAAIRALIAVGAPADMLIPELIECLLEPTLQVSAITALQELGPTAAAALPHLEELLRQPAQPGHPLGANHSVLLDRHIRRAIAILRSEPVENFCPATGHLLGAP